MRPSSGTVSYCIVADDAIRFSRLPTSCSKKLADHYFDTDLPIQNVRLVGWSRINQKIV